VTIPVPPDEDDPNMTEEERKKRQESVATLKKTVSATNLQAKDILEALRQKTSRPPKT
jgi:hypothetical protein